VKARIFGLFVSAGVLVLSGFLGSAQSLAGLLASSQPVVTNAYITNQGDNTVSVIDTATDTVTDTISVSSHPGVTVIARPFGVAVTPDGSKVYIANLLTEVQPRRWFSDSLSRWS
jgi:YVTN family beta-propeller protein